LNEFKVGDYCYCSRSCWYGKVSAKYKVWSHFKFVIRGDEIIKTKIACKNDLLVKVTDKKLITKLILKGLT
jgi:hypothetical protein